MTHLKASCELGIPIGQKDKNKAQSRKKITADEACTQNKIKSKKACGEAGQGCR